jgi:hypothetical protein
LAFNLVLENAPNHGADYGFTRTQVCDWQSGATMQPVRMRVLGSLSLAEAW